MMPPVVILDLECSPDHVGFIPTFLNLDDKRPAREQLDENYRHGGGWRPQSGFTQVSNHRYCLKYPGDPPLTPLAVIPIRKEVVLIYRYGYVAIFQEDGTFEACRMD
jgi:hypothetical protein